MSEYREYDPDFLVLPTGKDIGRTAAEAIAHLVKTKPKAVLGMATGDTPLPMYKELIRLHKKGLDFSQITFFNLDEYIGLPRTHPQSYHFYMEENFFRHINARPENIFIPDGMAHHINQECIHYEEHIKSRGGIDLQILGIGTNGHIGFCEPGVILDIRTHRAVLTEQTRQDNARFFASLEEVPTEAISMGLATILEARRIFLLASGSQKASAVRALLRDPLSSQVPATILRRHKNLHLMIDREAFALASHATQAPLWPHLRT